MKKISIRVLSTVLSFILMITLFSSVSGLSAFAIDNTPASTEVVEKVSVEKIVEETADNKAAEITEKVEETEEKTFSANSSIRTKSTTADAKGATSGIYTYSVSNGEATVTKCNSSALGSIEIPSTIDGYPVTSIGGWAFSGCTGLTSVTIPDSVTYIGWDAFNRCTGLTSITIPDSVTSIGDGAFYRCTSLTSITIPNSVTSIGDYAFDDCTSLTSVTIGNSVTSIGRSAFYNCTGLTSVTIGNSVTSIGDRAFSGCTGLTNVTIPNSVTSIGERAFDGCSSLEEITLPFVGDKRHTSTDTYQYPLGYIFGRLSYTGGTATTQYYYGSSTSSTTSTTYYIPSSLKKVTISDCDYIPRGAFYGCTGLTSITIPDSVTSIGGYAFYNCTSLTSVTVGNSVTSIGDYAFRGCTGLTKVNYTGTIADWCNISFGNYSANPLYYGENLYINDNLVTDLVIPDSVKEIKDYAFEGCTGLTSITIPDSVTSIGDSAFDGCTGLKSITIPNSVTSIGDWAFDGCSSLTSITIPDSVTSIGYSAFEDCTSLTSITIPDSVTSIGGSAFDGCTGLKKANYTGTIADWCNISFGDYSANPLCHAHNLYINDILVTDLVITDTVKEIMNYAFYRCTGLTSITIPDSVTSIGGYAFYNCTSLTSVTIGNSVTSIGDYAFRGCTGLKSITIPDSVTSINEAAFSKCSGLESLTVSNGNEIYHSSGNCIIETNTGELILGCKNSIIPNDGSVTSIGFDAFCGCIGLTSITIPDSVTSIGSGAFNGCSSLEEITLPFVGDKRHKSTDTYQYPLGYIFGISSYTGGTATTQYYYGNSTIFTTGETYYIPSSLKKVTITDCDYIPRGAFSSCTGLTSITIPDSVTSIGGYAFYNCTGLKKVNYTGTIADWCNIYFVDSDANPLSHAHNLYINDKLVTDLVIPDAVKEIKNYAFWDCTSLTSITIPDSVTSISSSAFERCTGLTSVTIPNSVTSIEDYAFYGCSSLNTVYYNGTQDEWNNVVIKSGNNQLHNAEIIFASDDSNIAKGTCGANLIWEYNTSTDTLTISGTGEMYGYSDSYNGTLYVTTAPWREYYNKMKTVVINSGVTSIGDSAFEDCTSLTSVTIPDSVTSIGYSAFEDCTGLTKVNYTGTIADWCNISFGNYSANPLNYAHNLYINDKLVTDLVIPDNVKEIKNYAFYGCKSLTSITIPDSVTSIGYEAFYGCTGLTSVTIGNSVTSLGFEAFRGCTGLTSITIPDSVTSIGWYAFYGCTGLTSVTIPDSVTSIGEHAFENSESVTIECRKNSIAAAYAKNNNIQYEYIPCETHSFGNWYSIKEPTCTESGIEEHECFDCDKKETRESGKPLGHAWLETFEKDENAHWHKCTRCEEVNNKTEHIYGEWVVTKPATVNENGQKKHICTVCGYEEYEVFDLENIKGDTNGDGVITDQDAIYLLFYYYFPDKYPVEQSCDFNNDGEVTDQDAIYLLFHYYFPDKYPIE